MWGRVQKYNPAKIEKKWQDDWFKSDTFEARTGSKKKKYYLLFEFPYPSGDGLHVGHCRPYIGMDVIARKRRMEGYNVLFPIGWDAFGLPTENYAIKKGVHPSVVTKKNTDNFKKQMQMLGLSLDWDREINTTDPKYYKWTQWIFLKLFEKGLAYKEKIAINWCPKDKIGLANEEVIDGKCERCGTKVEKREKEQWLIRITKYADRLIKDLDLVDYSERIKTQQKDWIGESHGALIKFEAEGADEPIEVFTTRIDTIFSGTFLLLAPGHKFVDENASRIENIAEVFAYRESVKVLSDIDRTNTQKEITGVQLKGILAKNPATGEMMPVWLADFVLEHYGTGAVFADAHDARDFAMAKKYGIPLRTSIEPADPELAQKAKNMEVCYEGEGTLYNSSEFNGLNSADARPKIIAWLQEKGLAEVKTSYKLRDWVFSRQHYWGEPIPMVFCEKDGWVPLAEKDLPLELPNVKKYEPTDTGESPLASIKNWVNTKCPKCKGPARRETDTMPNWAGSNWYFLRYTDPKDNKKFADKKALRYWMPVDWYNGGMEHTTLHLLYSRFIYKFLYDIGSIPAKIGVEPYKKRTSHGIILGERGIKMSKSRGNVVNPDSVAKQYGVDSLRVYEMFMGPFEQAIPWDTKGIIGSRRFLEKAYALSLKKTAVKPDMELVRQLHKTIKKVGEDIETLKFNTAISALMEFVNAWYGSEIGLDKKSLGMFLKILSPFAPHLSEELYNQLEFSGMCSQQKWPKFEPRLVREKNTLLIVQINGKLRDKVEVPAGTDQAAVEKMIMASEKLKPWLEGKEIRKVIFVADKLINIVI